MWTHHIKRLILENHHAIIPQKVRAERDGQHGGTGVPPAMVRGGAAAPWLHPPSLSVFPPPQAKEAILEMDLFCECHQCVSPPCPPVSPLIPQRHPLCPQTPRACPAAAPST